MCRLELNLEVAVSTSREMRWHFICAFLKETQEGVSEKLLMPLKDNHRWSS